MPTYPDPDAEYVEKTPEGLVAWFNGMDPERKLGFMAAAQRDSIEAHECLIADHVGRIAQIPKMHAALDKREAKIANLEEIIQRAIGIGQGAAVDAASISQTVKFPDNLAPICTVYAGALTLIELVLLDDADKRPS